MGPGQHNWTSPALPLGSTSSLRVCEALHALPPARKALEKSRTSLPHGQKPPVDYTGTVNRPDGSVEEYLWGRRVGADRRKQTAVAA